jgi:hypothetical protein
MEDLGRDDNTNGPAVEIEMVAQALTRYVAPNNIGSVSNVTFSRKPAKATPTTAVLSTPQIPNSGPNTNETHIRLDSNEMEDLGCDDDTNRQAAEVEMVSQAPTRYVALSDSDSVSNVVLFQETH